MNPINDNLRELISQYIEINDQEWTHFASLLEFRNFSKNEVIITQGMATKSIYFVVSGLLRTYFINGAGEEKTFHFSNENTFAADYESFLKRSQSRYSIQALEDSTVILMSLEALTNYYETLRYGDKLGRVIAEKYFFLWSDRIQDIYMLTPLERYNNMKYQFPGILQRVSQYYIASYLNISPVHLSRLKSSVLT